MKYRIVKNGLDKYKIEENHPRTYKKFFKKYQEDSWWTLYTENYSFEYYGQRCSSPTWKWFDTYEEAEKKLNDYIIEKNRKENERKLEDKIIIVKEIEVQKV